MNAYLVSHNGLGDNLFMIGGINYIKQFYDKVFFLCKDKYYSNVKQVFEDEPKVICIAFDHTNEKKEILKIMMDASLDDNNDLFVAGPCHKSYTKSRIRNQIFLKSKKIDKAYTINFSTLKEMNNHYDFIEGFYRDIGLNLTYFYEYFNIQSSARSQNLYDSVKSYRIIFVQAKSSNGKQLNIDDLIQKNKNKLNTIIICNDYNVYSKEEPQYQLSQKFVMQNITDYIDIIKNCQEIYIIDSCFIGLVLPLAKTNRLVADKVHIIRRQLLHKYKF